MDLTTLCPKGTKVAIGRPGASRIIKKALHLVCLLPRATQMCTLAPKVRKDHICVQKCIFDAKVLFGPTWAHPLSILQLNAETKYRFWGNALRDTVVHFRFSAKTLTVASETRKIGKNITTLALRIARFCTPLDLLTGATFLDGFRGPAGPVGTLRAI